MALNLAAALHQHLRGSGCRVFGSDVKLRVEAADAAVRLVKLETVLVVEVLSPSTAACDRAEKFAAYRQLPSLAEFLLVDIDAGRCELYRKGADGLWVLHPTPGGEPLHLASVGLTVDADALWAELEPDRPLQAGG